MKTDFEIAKEIFDEYPEFEENGICFEDVHEYVKWWLKNNIGEEISIDCIKNVVCYYFNIDIEKLDIITKKKEIVQSRQIAMFFSRRLTKYSLARIGENIGGKDHATVKWACTTVSNISDVDINYRKDLKNIEYKLTGKNEIFV